MALYTHDPKKVTLSIGGFSIEGFHEGSTLMLAPDAEVSTTTMGVDKDATRNVNTNISWTLTFSLQNGSPSNSILNGMAQGQTALPFMLKDGNTTNTLAVGTIYLKNLPSLGGALEAEGREYTMTAVDVTINFGGAA
ncbi:hypothetical protein UFOVP380_24 [uncultured Caudovirales phage]|uniref:Uncharacterized protein n=1 Tax=uncultured Caudovirales phage TaxID=2100421 RepID=A0A6J7X4Q3_9CAUD|nr:hypothetical protein UFOVP380_24 [uncultured Caudovirales phage]